MIQNSYKWYLFLSLIVTISGVSFAQETAEVSEDSIHAYYVHEYHDKFYVKPIITARSLSLELTDQNGEIERIEYAPVSNAYMGVGLYLFEVGAELSFRLPNNNRDAKVYGETDALDFQSNIYAKKWGADISWQRYSGLYLKKPQRHFSDWEVGDDFPQRRDLKLNNFQLNGFYIFNHKTFSYRSAYNQADRQLRKEGSFLLGVSTSTFRFASDSSLVPQESRSVFSDNSKLESGRFTSLGLMPGYTYTYVWNDFYANLSLSLGPTHVWARYNLGGRDKEDIVIRASANFRMALGYNSDTFFGGMTFVSQTVGYNIDNLDVNASSGNFKLFIGYRFQEWGVLKKTVF